MDSRIVLLLGFLQVASCAEPYHYVVHGDGVDFNLARDNCQRDGNLTSLATINEIQEVKQIMSEYVSAVGEYTFWIGLWRPKATCTVRYNKLNGFMWINGDTDAEEVIWKKDPELTCTHARCVYVSVWHDGSILQDWGLEEDVCTKKHPFICKVKGERAPKDCQIPAITGTHDRIHQEGNPSKLDVICKDTKTFNLICNTETLEWTTEEGISVDFSEICVHCADGYEKSLLGRCVDINECDKQPCGLEENCINTEGSFICKPFPPKPHPTPVPTSQQTDAALTETHSPDIIVNPDKTIDRQNIHLVDGTPPSPDYSKIYIPIICAVLALLLLLVIILAIVACCRRRKRRRSKKLANQPKKNPKEQMALKDSMEKMNEK